MSYKQIKWLIMWIPTITIGLWEYLRHTVLLPYLSMELGNLLAPVIVLLVTVTLLRKLFARMEETQDALRREQMLKAALEEREQLSRELHDGISQSLFLLSVKLDKLDQANNAEDVREQTGQIRDTVRHVYEDVRQSIASLRTTPVVTDLPWMQSIYALAAEISEGSGLAIVLDWQMPDAKLTAKEKIELLALLREALLNIQKHARAGKAIVRCVPHGDDREGFCCTVADDGVGIADDRRTAEGCYGLRMMENRAAAMGWEFAISRTSDVSGTTVEICKRGT
ncbi:sensor histidine kinase [Paenibacillaceae bacterium]|nr:sensor histidine kinase [Paenibacillaceae bacterium]